MAPPASVFKRYALKKGFAVFKNASNGYALYGKYKTRKAFKNNSTEHKVSLYGKNGSRVSKPVRGAYFGVFKSKTRKNRRA